jgi:hypothetical protein
MCLSVIACEVSRWYGRLSSEYRYSSIGPFGEIDERKSPSLSAYVEDETVETRKCKSTLASRTRRTSRVTSIILYLMVEWTREFLVRVATWKRIFLPRSITLCIRLQCTERGQQLHSSTSTTVLRTRKSERKIKVSYDKANFRDNPVPSKMKDESHADAKRTVVGH